MNQMKRGLERGVCGKKIQQHQLGTERTDLCRVTLLVSSSVTGPYDKTNGSSNVENDNNYAGNEQKMKNEKQTWAYKQSAIPCHMYPAECPQEMGICQRPNSTK